jgi:hypothetical protein
MTDRFQIISYGLRFLKKNPKDIGDVLKLVLVYTYAINIFGVHDNFSGSIIMTLLAAVATIGLRSVVILRSFDKTNKNTEARQSDLY